MADDHRKLVSELEKAGWWVLVEDGALTTAVHPSTDVALKFGRHPSLNRVRADAAKALGQVKRHSSAQRRRQHAAEPQRKAQLAAVAYQGRRDADEDRERVRLAVMARESELASIRSLMRHG